MAGKASVKISTRLNPVITCFLPSGSGIPLPVKPSHRDHPQPNPAAENLPLDYKKFPAQSGKRSVKLNPTASSITKGKNK